VVLIGLSFKVGSDDLRESPFVRFAEQLIGKGVPLHIFDPDVAIDDVFGRNRAYVEQLLPHVGHLLVTNPDGLLAEADLVIVGKKIPQIELLLQRLRPDQAVIDLVGLPELRTAMRPWSSTPDDLRRATASLM
jgi:GDP-mannose 6-dehydrogenase